MNVMNLKMSIHWNDLDPQVGSFVQVHGSIYNMALILEAVIMQ
jgi:hypothetical protein